MEVVTLSKTPEPEKLVCQAARGCYFDGFVGEAEYAELMDGVKGDTLAEKEAHLIEDLLRKGHYGPFEHAQISFAVEGVSRSLMAQATRHRLLTFDVQSQRYVDFREAGVIVPRSLQEATLSRFDGLTDVSSADAHSLIGRFLQLHEQSVELYEDMVSANVPKEDARFALLIGTPVNMTFSGNARTMLHFLDMRYKSDSQWEIRELSKKILKELRMWMPHTFRYYKKHRPNKLAP